MNYKRKFSIFISSTYEDLKEERQAAMQVALENDLIPVGMEQFHAAPIDQWSLIKKMIDDCDFYLLIIGGCYGSMDGGEQISFTEKEYNYAKQQGMPVYVLVENENNITKSKMDKTDTSKKQEKLNKFREKVMDDKNTVDIFDDIKALRYNLSASLRNAKEYASADAGWVRVTDVQDIINHQDTSKSQNDLNEEKKQSDAVANMQSALEIFADSLKKARESVNEKRTIRVEGETLYID